MEFSYIIIPSSRRMLLEKSVKLNDTPLLPAYRRYQGVTMNILGKDMEDESFSKNISKVLFLSPIYGLINSDTRIPNYREKIGTGNKLEINSLKKQIKNAIKLESQYLFFSTLQWYPIIKEFDNITRVSLSRSGRRLNGHESKVYKGLIVKDLMLHNRIDMELLGKIESTYNLEFIFGDK